MLLENTQKNSEETEERQNEVIVCLSYIPIEISIYYKIYIKILWIRGLYCNMDSSFNKFQFIEDLIYYWCYQYFCNMIFEAIISKFRFR